MEKSLVESTEDASTPNDKNEISRDHEVEIEDIPDKKVERAVAKVIQSEFSGPIPPPSIIKGYEDILPGTAERIVSMAENQAKHRQDMEKIMVSERQEIVC